MKTVHFQLIFFLNCSLFITTLFANSETHEERFQQGLYLLDQKSFVQAKELFESLLKEDKKSSWAWLGLGVLQDRQKPGDGRAVRFLKKALFYDENNAEAYYQLALVYSHQQNKYLRVRENLERAIYLEPDRIEAWELFGEVNVSFWMEEESFRYYSRAVKRNPDIKMLSSFIDFGMQYGKEKDLLELLDILKKKDPGNPHIYLAESRVYLNNGHFLTCSNYLSSLPDSIKKKRPAQFDLLMADALMNQGDAKKGAQLYWEALSLVQDSTDAQMFYQDTYYLFTDQEKDSVQHTSTHFTVQFYKRFWNQRDPNPITAINERLVEHYNRLGYARTHHRRYSSMKKSFQHVLHRDSNMLIGEEIETAPNQSIIDDMGITIVRHGFPDEKYMNPNAVRGDDSWEQASFLYLENGSRPRMVFHYLRFPSSGWTFSTLPVDYTGLFFLGPKYAVVAMYLERHVEKQKHYQNNMSIIGDLLELQAEDEAEQGWSELDDPSVWAANVHLKSGAGKVEAELIQKEMSVSPDLAKQSIADIEIGMTTESIKLDFTDFPMPLSCYAFKGKNGYADIEMFNAVPGSQIEKTWSSGNYEMELTMFVGVYTDEWDKIDDFHGKEQFDINIHRDWEGRSIIQQRTLSLFPGDYNLVLQSMNSASKATSVQRFGYAAPDFYADKLSVSDIILCSDIHPAEHSSRFCRGEIAFQPRIFDAFQSDEQLGLYFEVYGLDLDVAGKSNYSVQLALRKQGDLLDSPLETVKTWFGGRPSVGSIIDYAGVTSDEPITLSLQFGEQKVGTYDLSLVISDKISGQKVKKNVEVVISD